MNRKLETIVASLIAVLLLASITALGAETDVKGMISGRTGETLIVNTETGKVTVVLTEGTKIRDKRGLFGLQEEQMAPTVLIPGLKVSVDGTSDGEGRVVAKTITVDGDDIESSQMIQAGLQPTADQVLEHEKELLEQQKAIGANRKRIVANQEQIAANTEDIETNQQKIAEHKKKIEQNMSDIQSNTQRFTALADYDTKAQATVKFASGSTKISKDDTDQLKQLADTAKGLTGYIIEVTGFADSSGNAAMNTKLSEARAKTVITFLMQQGGVPVRHIVAPGAMGEYGEAATNETKEGRAENRRVEVKVLVNKGIAGK
ncbi:MAG TPA: OmpA family protein [Pyrinomonadaceae bacterium]|jgi:outer membrane protein OmpA-like peptidoglycan-associated protein|nr:OmpA family protein [Pyrinomonadaceae bacterium]